METVGNHMYFWTYKIDIYQIRYIFLSRIYSSKCHNATYDNSYFRRFLNSTLLVDFSKMILKSTFYTY